MPETNHESQDCEPARCANCGATNEQAKLMDGSPVLCADQGPCYERRRKGMFEADKESRSVNQTADAAKPDAGGSEDRQHENPCPEPPTCGIAGCVGKHHPQDHNDIIDASTDDQSRSLFHSLQDVIRERDALRAELERVKAERNTIHDWYVDAKTENVALRAEVERMRPIVEAACDYMDTVGRYDTTGIHRTGKGSRARIRQCVDAYRKDTNDE